MKKRMTIALTLILCMLIFSAQASQKLIMDIDKEAILAHDISAADIRIRPEGMVRVTRHSLWPWDEAGTKWSMFVEIENISDEKIVIDEDWLVACKANRDEIATADYMFDYTTNRFNPGEKIVLYAGAYPYVREKRTDADAAMDTWDVEGMEDFAGRIRQAKVLRVRLETRGDASNPNWREKAIVPTVSTEGRMLCFEWTNETGETLAFRTIGAIVSDGEGRMIDVIRSTYSRGAIAAPGETLTFEKELPPYIADEQMENLQFEAFGYLMATDAQ